MCASLSLWRRHCTSAKIYLLLENNAGGLLKEQLSDLPFSSASRMWGITSIFHGQKGVNCNFVVCGIKSEIVSMKRKIDPMSCDYVLWKYAIKSDLAGCNFIGEIMAGIRSNLRFWSRGNDTPSPMYLWCDFIIRIKATWTSSLYTTQFG